MVSRPLGRTGLAVSALGLGTVKIGRNTDVKYARAFDLPSAAEARALLEAALAAGITLYDTAPAYGASEIRLAEFARAHRDRIVLSTKAGERYSDGASTHDFSAAAIVASAEDSLRRLGVDVLDLLLLHSDGRDVEILEGTDALAGLERLKRAGKVRAAGLSAKTPDGVAAAVRHGLDVVMAPYSAADPARGPALAAAHAAGLGVLAIKGLAAGRLDPAAAIRHVLGQEFVDALVLGTLDPDHLRAAVAAAAAARPAKE